MPGELPQVRVEFLGIARHRAGVAELLLPPGTVREVLTEIAMRFPRLDLLLPGGELSPVYLLSTNGAGFLNQVEGMLLPDDALLILGADAGG